MAEDTTIMDEAEVPAKKAKIDAQTCIVCSKDSSNNELTKPQDEQSWVTLQQAAKRRQFEPILNFVHDKPTGIPDVYYHTKCRNEFIHKKSLERLSKEQTCVNVAVTSKRRLSSRDVSATSSRVYDKMCVFCERQTKYVKGTRTRETLIVAMELRVDQTIRDVAMKRQDEKILAVTSRDIVAAEAYYHRSCYKDYTRPEKCTTINDEGEDDYSATEKFSLNMLFTLILSDIFSNPRVISLTELCSKLVSFFQQHGIDQVNQSTKNHLRRSLETEFGDSLHFFTIGRRVYIRPDNLMPESIFAEYVTLKEKLDAYDKDQTHKSLVERVAIYLRDQIKQSISKQPWPPHPDELNAHYFSPPASLVQFLNALLSERQDPSARVNRLTWSFAQDIVSAVTRGEVLTPKHVLLAWSIKALTGNVELIKTLNRLGHGCSYSRLEEIDTALFTLYGEGGKGRC